MQRAACPKPQFRGATNIRFEQLKRISYFYQKRTNMKNKTALWSIIFWMALILLFVACRAGDCGCP